MYHLYRRILLLVSVAALTLVSIVSSVQPASAVSPVLFLNSSSFTCSSVTVSGVLSNGDPIIGFNVFNIGTGASLVRSNFPVLGAPPVYLTVGAGGAFSGTANFTPQPAGSLLEIGVYGMTSASFGGFDGQELILYPGPCGSKANFTDGRCNQEPYQSVAVYPDNKGGYNFYALYNGVGYFAMHVTEQNLDDNADTGVTHKIAEAKGVQLFRLAGGGLQVNRMGKDNKMYSYNIGSCGAMED